MGGLRLLEQKLNALFTPRAAQERVMAGTKKTPFGKGKGTAKKPAAAKAKAAVAAKKGGRRAVIGAPAAAGKAPAYPTNAKTAEAWARHYGSDKAALTAAQAVADKFTEETGKLLASAGMHITATSLPDAPKGKAARSRAKGTGAGRKSVQTDENLAKVEKALGSKGGATVEGLMETLGICRKSVKHLLVSAKAKKGTEKGVWTA